MGEGLSVLNGISACVRRRGATFAVILLLTCMASAVFGLSATCSTSCDEPFGDCAGLCLDCSCCPNGASTSGETASVSAELVAFTSAVPTPARSHVDAPPGEILHIPKPVRF